MAVLWRGLVSFQKFLEHMEKKKQEEEAKARRLAEQAEKQRQRDLEIEVSWLESTRIDALSPHAHLVPKTRTTGGQRGTRHGAR